MQPKMLGLICAAAAAATAWESARRIAALQPAAGSDGDDHLAVPITAVGQVAPRPGVVPTSGPIAVSTPPGLSQYLERAIYAQISDLREHLAGQDGRARRSRLFGRV